MHLFVLFVISLRLVGTPCAEVCIVSCCVHACAPSWCFSSRLLVRSFPHRDFAIQFIVGVLVSFELFLISITLFPTWVFAGWLYQLRGWFALSPQGFLQFRFASVLLSIC